MASRTTRPSTARTLAVVTACLVLGHGCGAQPDPEPAPDAGASPSAGRCARPLGGEETVLEVGADVRLPAAVYGDKGADTALVLLHQTNLDGLCGWDAFGRDAAERGFAAVSFDMCGWGASECPEEWSERTSEQVAAAVDLARTGLEADRVVLVGASMGGARTVFAMADGVDADAWVSLSGAPAWDGRVSADEAAAIDAPGMVMHDPDDGDAEFAASRLTAERAGAEFVRGRGGHGYDMVLRIDGRLTPLGERVLDFAAAGRP